MDTTNLKMIEQSQILMLDEINNLKNIIFNLKCFIFILLIMIII